MVKVFNTEFEVSLRLLLLLECLTTGITVDRAAAFDFIAVYGKEFSIAESNLHGDNNMAFSEFPLRRQAVREALKAMVLDGWVQVKDGGSGFVYNLSPEAMTASKNISDAYPMVYRILVKEAYKKYGSLSEERLIEMINRASTQALRR